MKLWLPNHHAEPKAPVEVREAIGLWARQYGGFGDVVWAPDPINCWAVRLSLKPGDPRLKNPDEGTHFEQVLLQEWVDPRKMPSHPKKDLLKRDRFNRLQPGFVALTLEELGTEGILEILSKGSLMSGRGEFKSAQDALDRIRAHHNLDREKALETARDNARHKATQVRRRVLKIPFLPVGIDLGPKKSPIPSSGASS